MKILITLLTLLSFVYAAQIDEFATEVNYLRNYDMAVQTAKEQKKLLMIVVVGDYCPWCKKFERKTLKDSEVMAKVNENFVGIIIDKYKDKGKYPKEYYAPLIPAVFFIDPKNEKSLFETVAYMKPDEFMENMDYALNANKAEKK
ncbi:MAG TPA: thioredoxin family protein [Sulfuricurvum sp.]|nr:MAG: thioredoxin [Campylobacterales bacterium 16-40-21]OZA02743.1 MAG: thioredoxin [Sulfuricurvum sp. 17-40-25]HQS66714.1 thioredoxin family protein [Sulfuricurvum sp.]HQT37329.1 thioredoxin family protein [Sulfuricurvum sp.]